jgi:hypothetical protein
MFNVISKDKMKKPEKFELTIGDIVVTESSKFLVVCDGWGHYYFIKLEDGFIVAEDSKGAYKAPCDKMYSIGDKLIKSESKHYYNIVTVVSVEDVEITVELN